MKTTLELNDALLAQAKALGARERVSLTRLIEEGLRMRLRAARRPGTRNIRRLPVYRGKSGARGRNRSPQQQVHARRGG